MNKAIKPWGISVRSYLDSCVQVEWIRVAPTGYSSIHLHRHKTNLFIVHEGVLEVRFFDDGLHRIGSVRLREGISHMVPQGSRHQFFAYQKVSATEVYCAPNGALDPNDILRYSENGCVQSGDQMEMLEALRQYCSGCNRVLTGADGWEPAQYQGAIRALCHECQKTYASK